MESPIDIILLTHNELENTKRCVDALYQNTSVPFKLTVIDDSTDETPKYIMELAHKKGNIKYTRPNIFIKSANQVVNLGVKMTQSDPFVFLINSAFVSPNWLTIPLYLMEYEWKVGLVGFKIVDPETHLITDAAGGSAGEPENNMTFAMETIRVGWAATLIRRAALPEGGLDENYYIGFRGVDDTDNCFEIKKRGWRIIYNGYNSIYHVPRSSSCLTRQTWKETNENCRRFLEKWKGSTYLGNCGITYDSRI